MEKDKNNKSYDPYRDGIINSDADLFDFMEKDAEKADEAKRLADKAEFMGYISIALAILSIVLAALRLLLP